METCKKKIEDLIWAMKEKGYPREAMHTAKTLKDEIEEYAGMEKDEDEDYSEMSDDDLEELAFDEVDKKSKTPTLVIDIKRV